MPIRGSLIAMAVFCIALAGCRPEGEPAPSPRDFQNESPDYPLSDTGTLQCSRSKDRSCLVGEVVARHSIVVGGYRFFDATDLGRQLEQVVEVATDRLKLRDAVTQQMEKEFGERVAEVRKLQDELRALAEDTQHASPFNPPTIAQLSELPPSISLAVI